jgi:hypothetical protein
MFEELEGQVAVLPTMEHLKDLNERFIKPLYQMESQIGEFKVESI